MGTKLRSSVRVRCLFKRIGLPYCRIIATIMFHHCPNIKSPSIDTGNRSRTFVRLPHPPEANVSPRSYTFVYIHEYTCVLLVNSLCIKAWRQFSILSGCSDATSWPGVNWCVINWRLIALMRCWRDHLSLFPTPIRHTCLCDNPLHIINVLLLLCNEIILIFWDQPNTIETFKNILCT